VVKEENFKKQKAAKRRNKNTYH